MSGKIPVWQCWCSSLIIVGVSITCLQQQVFAQITPDNTLPNNSSVIRDGNTFNITGGTQTGSNLFHSFSEFSVPANNTALFNNSINIQNIISRVTGGSASNIDGLIKANGTANLFLINPKGIIFGQGAKLDIGGSFVATTASAIRFGDQGIFSASNPNTPPLLTVNPSAFLFNQITATQIQNHSVAPADIDPAGFNAFGLRVPDGKSLLLVGGNISMDGGQLNAYGGRVELGGLAEPGTVTVKVDGNNLNLGFPTESIRGDVSLTNGAGVHVEAAGGGSISLNARNLDVSGGSILSAGIGQGLGTVDSVAGDITLFATGTIKVESSQIKNNVNQDATGNSGNINITTGSLEVTNGAMLESRTRGQGNAGNLTINASGDILNTGTLDSSSFSDSGNAGNAGAITLNAGGDILSTGTLDSSSFSDFGNSGNGGAITLNAGGDISIKQTRTSNSLPFISLSTLNSSSFSGSGNSGDGGAITLKAGGDIQTTGTLDSSSFSGPGNAGNGGAITLNGGNITTETLNSFSSSSSGNAGDGGAITLNANGDISTFRTSGRLLFLGILRSSSFSYYGNAGDGGAITLNANGDISIASLDSSSFSDSGNAGDGGAITLNTGGDINTSRLGGLDSSSISFAGDAGDGGAINLFARNGDITGADLSSLSFSQELNGGKGGDVTIEAKNNIRNVEILTESSNSISGTVHLTGFDNLEITNTKIITSRQFLVSKSSGDGAIFAWLVDLNDKGQSGNVNITSTGNLNFNNSSIESDSKGSAPAGNVNIFSPGIITFNNSKIVSNSSSTGAAGSIIVSADQGITLADSKSRIFAQASAEGKAGSISIDTPKLTLQQDAEISTSTTGSGKAGDITLNTDILNLVSGGKVLAFTSGSGDGGTITVNASKEVNFGIGVPDFASILSVETSGAGKAGDIFVTTSTLNLSNTAQITATATATATNSSGRGSITLNASQMNLAGIVGVFAETQGQSPAGTLTLQPDNNKPTLNIALAPLAKISASTSFRGNGGDLLVSAPQAINISGQGKLAVETTGTGNAGNIEITTQKLTLSDGVQISASTNSSGKAGNIILNVGENITLAGTGTGLFASTSENSTGKSGNIIIDPRIMTIRDGAKIAVDSQGENIGGDIELTAGFLTLDQGTISAQTRSNTGGNITLNLQDLLLLRNGSQITATAGNQEFGGDGGNITINSPFIVAVPGENSDITANAFRGSGGKIAINATGIYGIALLSREDLQRLSPDLDPSQVPTSDITAISQTNPTLSGTIQLNTPDIDLNSGLVELPTIPVDAEVAQSCHSPGYAQTKFVITGRGGLPSNPEGILTSDAILIDWVSVEASNNNHSLPPVTIKPTTSNPEPIVEATGAVLDASGQIVLTANSSTVTPHAFRQNPIQCHQK
ncbi:filamentous hemagglutinin outer membrane protein [Nostoc sp. NIES-4103]|nr:filamentous hemagglutinin outer membrane protein [Nostoc sp. NIES-4103]